jgi:hypothetical protein
MRSSTLRRVRPHDMQVEYQAARSELLLLQVSPDLQRFDILEYLRTFSKHLFELTILSLLSNAAQFSRGNFTNGHGIIQTPGIAEHV